MSNHLTEISTSNHAKKPMKKGKVFLVGAGPGDPDLLTVKALKIIQNCDVILYDNLVSEPIKALFPMSAKPFFVGKKTDNHSIAQQDLNKLLVSLANKGQTVCRLKGGDPFIFGRGSEEMLSLHQAGIATEVVPGITAASGCTSYAGIPLTHRGLAQACSFITGHGADCLDLDWSALAGTKHTLVFYMGLNQLDQISAQLNRHGMDKNTPAALIEHGTRSQQRVVTTTLALLSQQAKAHRLSSPTLIVIGEVVNLQQQLQWFSSTAQSQFFTQPNKLSA